MIARVLTALSLLGGASCLAHEVGGKTASEVFSNPSVAELASTACEGRTSQVQQLVKGGVDVNAAGHGGTTPLFWALTCENVEGVEALLMAGADPNEIASGITPVGAASTYKNPKLLMTLLRYGGNPNVEEVDGHWTALSRAFSLGVHEDQWQNYYALLEAGADVNKPNKLGEGIGHLAVMLGQFGKAKELLDRGYGYDLAKMVKFAEMHSTDPKVLPEKERLFEALAAKGYPRTAVQTTTS